MPCADNPSMNLHFTKMQGAGNDFVVIDGINQNLDLTADQFRQLGDRRFGVGADQILIVERTDTPGVDFAYRIFNNSGDEVEQCGNGARCFVRYVVDKGLSNKAILRVETMNRQLELVLQPDGRVRVDMGAPELNPEHVPFHSGGLEARVVNGFELWPLSLDGLGINTTVDIAAVSMGNPHAVQRVDDVDTAPVLSQGPLIEVHARFPRKVNAGFMQVVSRDHIHLRVFERGAGETLSCGTGACAAVVAGIKLGWLDSRVDVDTRGGRLTIEWDGKPSSSVFMTGPAQTVYEGEITL
ncbi:diaminopimelate epimerase [soil metagenome]